MTKELVDYDLDMYNALKGFPQNETSAVIYIRIEDKPKDDDSVNTAMIIGTNFTLIKAIVNAMMDDDNFADVVISSQKIYQKVKNKKP